MRIFEKIHENIAVYSTMFFISSATISAFLSYQSILNSINENTKQIEVTQMMILKDIVRKAEKNPCPVSDAEWDDYILNYTTLYELKIKYKKISKNAPWQPIKRLRRKTKKCLKNQ